MQTNVVEELPTRGPEKRFRAGAISAAVWKNASTNPKGEPVQYNSVTFERSYKDKDNKWQTTGSLRLNDLPKAALVLGEAYKYLALKGEEA